MKTALLPLIISTLSPSLFGGEIANIVHALSTPTSFLTDSSTLAQRSLKTQKKKALKGEKKVIANNKKAKHAKKAKSGAPSGVPSDMLSNIPSSVPSNIPSDVPSDVPLHVPSDVPSHVPSYDPSGIPLHVPSSSDSPSTVPSKPPTRSDCSRELFENGMSRDAVKRSFVAAKLSALIYELLEDSTADKKATYNDVFGNGGERGESFVFPPDNVDAIYTAKINEDYCAVAFRGTVVTSTFEDVLTNAFVSPAEFKMKHGAMKGEVCDVHSGYETAYENLKKETEKFLRDCTNECPNCEVLLTGHSQGGGIAEIAALKYRNLKLPLNKLYVIGIAGPQALGKNCLKFFLKEERCRHFRYIMSGESAVSSQGRAYDPIPMLATSFIVDGDNNGIFDGGILDGLGKTYATDSKGVALLGHELFLNQQDALTVALYEFDGHFQVSGEFGEFYNFSLHESQGYVENIQKQHEKFPKDISGLKCNLPTDGFPVGSACNPIELNKHVEENCIKNFADCQDFTCQTLNNGPEPNPERFCK